jgi:hypothetical protein
MCVATHYSADISLSRISSQKMKDISLGYAAFEFFLLHLFFFERECLATSNLSQLAVSKEMAFFQCRLYQDRQTYCSQNGPGCQLLFVGLRKLINENTKNHSNEVPIIQTPSAFVVLLFMETTYPFLKIPRVLTHDRGSEHIIIFLYFLT